MSSCVIIVENLPVPFDRRVWQEARALRDAGWSVSVICPKSEQHPAAFETLEDIEIFRHSLPLEAKGKLAFLLEFSAALFHESRLLFKVARRRGFDVIQVCNPPDLLFLVALPWKLRGKKLVFDQHDLCPELYAVKFGPRGAMYWLLKMAERLTYASADLVICANETFRKLAIARGGRKPEDVVAVYSVPDKARMRRVAPDPALRGGARMVLGYVGIIGDQDGVDHLMRAFAHLRAQGAGEGVRAVVVGDGPARPHVQRLAEELGLGDHVSFTGYLRGEALLAALSTFDIGVIPDPVNACNDKLSMNKVFEYSAFGVPSVSYPLSETMNLLGRTGTYSADDTPEGLGQAIMTLIRDDELRQTRGAEAKALADRKFDWAREAGNYVAAYERLMSSTLQAKVALAERS